MNKMNDRLKISLIKCRTKFERKSTELKDLTNKILTLLLDEEFEEKLSLKIERC